MCSRVSVPVSAVAVALSNSLSSESNVSSISSVLVPAVSSTTVTVDLRLGIDVDQIAGAEAAVVAELRPPDLRSGLPGDPE